MTNCGVCNSGFAHNAYRVTCGGCSKVFHIKCVCISKEDYLLRVKQKTPFLCDICNKAKRKSQLAATSDSDKHFVLLELVEQIKLEVSHSNQMIRAEIDKHSQDLKEFKEQFDKYSDNMNENNNKLDTLGASLSSLGAKVDEIFDRQKGFDKRICELHELINDIDQQARENVLEISGFPASENDNIFEIIRKISNAVEFPIAENMISDCYRIKPRNASSLPGLIIVHFVRKIDKRAFFAAAWKKKTLSTRDVGFLLGEATRIYVNNSLTQHNRKLLNSCKEFKKNRNFKFLWNRNGRIFLKKDEASAAIHVKSADALRSICS
ncbi:hypothetical protein GE061_001567 [Apolygus lucorum]|uniref:PHD-type domain-containing protein n=1 Tax=Apolygus lucorum TaxID=248454 RepID=A0A8S9Y7Q5_APOLU|nr:hypothetical protein GE061_001567 [Apolygus lucorum]